MNDRFHYDPTAYREQVIRIAEHATAKGNPVPAPAAAAVCDINSYHGAAIEDAEQDRLSKLYPRLHR